MEIISQVFISVLDRGGLSEHVPLIVKILHSWGSKFSLGFVCCRGGGHVSDVQPSSSVCGGSEAREEAG